MNVVCDAPGSERSHGYTDDGDELWYWVIDHRSNDLSFRESGTHTDHPIRTGDVPDEVRETTKEWANEHVQGANL